MTQGVGTSLSQQLSDLGALCHVAQLSQGATASESGFVDALPGSACSSVDAAMDSAANAIDVVFLWSLDTRLAALPDQRTEQLCAELLHLIQQLANRRRQQRADGSQRIPELRLWVVTRGAQLVPGGDPLDAAQACAVGIHSHSRTGVPRLAISIDRSRSFHGNRESRQHSVG